MAFGAIGGAIAGAQFEQTGNSLMAAVRSQGVLPHETLARALQHELEAAGYSVRIATVSWTDASPVDRLPRLQELGPGHQRVLVLNPRQIGFASFVVTHPYRPLVRLTASLYGPDRSKPLYAGALETGYDIEHSGWTAVPAGPIAMQTQSDLLAEPARIAEALRDALARMAQATTRDLLGARAATAAGAPVPVAGVPSAVPPGDYAGSLRCGAY